MKSFYDYMVLNFQSDRRIERRLYCGRRYPLSLNNFCIHIHLGTSAIFSQSRFDPIYLFLGAKKRLGMTTKAVIGFVVLVLFFDPKQRITKAQGGVRKVGGPSRRNCGDCWIWSAWWNRPKTARPQLWKTITSRNLNEWDSNRRLTTEYRGFFLGFRQFIF